MTVRKSNFLKTAIYSLSITLAAWLIQSSIRYGVEKFSRDITEIKAKVEYNSANNDTLKAMYRAHRVEDYNFELAVKKSDSLLNEKIEFVHTIAVENQKTITTMLLMRR